MREEKDQEKIPLSKEEQEKRDYQTKALERMCKELANERVKEKANEITMNCLYKGLRIYVEAFQKDLHKTAVDKGWWGENRSDGECIALIHSELSEALEALREGNPPSVKAKGVSHVEEELADVIIRILDFAEHKKYNIGKALRLKAEYNKSRSYKHGGKKF